ncbi:MAG TPA: hypothetical protein VF913_18775 [Xanthobacteraceae bacterium]
MKHSQRFPSRFLKAADLKPEGAVATIERVEMEPVGQGKDQKTKPVLYFRNASKVLVLNNVNDETIGKVLGSDDDKDWRGQKICLYPSTTTFGKEVVDCIRVRAVDDGGEEEDENPAPRKSRPPSSEDESDIDIDLNDEIPF